MENQELSEGYNQNNLETKKIADSWRERYAQELDKLISKEDISKEDIVDFIWENGLLNRLAPTDPIAKQARIDLDKEVWPGTREDVGLYLKILYFIEEIKHALNEHHSVCNGTITFVHEVLGELFKNQKINSLYNQDSSSNQTGDKYDRLIRNILDQIGQKALKEVKNRGGKTKIIKPGMQAIIGNKLPVKVEKITKNGKIWLEIDRDKLPFSEYMSRQDELLELRHLDGANPEDLDPDLFA